MTKSPKFVIVDYGVGNLYSLLRAFQFFKADVEISEESVTLKNADAIVLPGVGAFEAGIKGLQKRSLTNTVKEFARSGKPILGICLGAQLMLSKGYEFGVFEGLNLIPGRVTRLERLPEKEKIPHIGWNKVYPTETVSWKDTIFNSLKQNFEVYFVHSYILEPENKKDVLGLSNYGGYEFCSAIRKNNIYGCQFHPEKSGEVGLKIIRNFINLST